MTAHVTDACVGCGLCPGICPAVFTMTDAGVAVAKDKGDVPAGQEVLAQQAADGCPVSAIEVDV